MNRQTIADLFVSSVLGSEEGSVLGSFVISAEVVHPDRTELRVFVSEGIAPWTARGMLKVAEEMVAFQMAENDDFYGEDIEGREEEQD